MSFLSNLFAAPGSGFAASQNQQNAQAGSIGSQLLQSILPYYNADTQYAGSMEGPRQQDISNLLMQISPGNTPNLIRTASNAAFANAGRAANQSAAQGQESGYSPSFVQGNTTAINNEGAQQANAASNYYNSPEYQAQQGANALSLYNQAQTNPFAQGTQSAFSDIYGQPNAIVGQSPLGAIGSIVGTALGGGGLAGSLLGGQSGGGGASTQAPYGVASPGYGQGPEQSYWNQGLGE